VTDLPPTASKLPASLQAVLSFAWDVAAFTASDAMGATGLTRSTTIDAIDGLVELALLRELPNARAAGEYRKGRPARRFELRADAAVLVGVDAGHEHVTANVADLSGGSLAIQRHTLEIDGDSAGERRALIGQAVDEALATAGRTRRDVLSVCVGVPAPVDARGASPAHRNGFWERMNPELAELFSSWAPLVRVENDASLAAFAEGALGAAKGCSNYVALLAGARLGAGVVVDGHMLRGVHGGVGEMVAFDHVAGVGSAHGLGSRAAQWARLAVSQQAVSPDGPLARTPPDEIDGKLVLELAASGDPDALGIVHRVGQVLARIASVLGSMFDPELIIVSGALSARAMPVVAAAQASLPTELDLPAPRIVASTLGGDVVVTGAVAAASATARAHVLDIWQQRPGDHEQRRPAV
jgi:predicted NBD/HSP70 family sugar kinase